MSEVGSRKNAAAHCVREPRRRNESRDANPMTNNPDSWDITVLHMHGS